MKHDILGEIELQDGKPFDATATIRHGAGDIKVQISADGEPLEASIRLAADFVVRLAEFDDLAKRVASRDLRNTYNEGWNEYDETQEDGSTKSVSNPALSEPEFEAKLTLKSVNVTGTTVIDLFYSDEGMFWGHSVVVTSLDGTDFTEVHAELFG